MSWKWPRHWRGGDWGLWLLGLGLACAWVPEIREQFTIPRLALASVGIPLALLTVTEARVGWWPLVLLGWASASTLWSPLWADALNGLWLVALWAGAFVLGRSRDIWALVWGAAWGLVVQVPLVALQAAHWQLPFGWKLAPGWWTVPSVVDPAGLFGNRNSLAELAALVLVPLAFKGARWMPLALVPCLALPMSKGAIGAVVICVLGALWTSTKWRRLAQVACLLGVLGTGTVLALAPPATIESSEASASNAQSLELRLAIWHDTIGAWSWRGWGVGQFWPLAPAFARSYDSIHKRFDHAHNDAVELGFNLGIVGVGLWLALCAGALGGLPRPEAFGLLAFLGLGLGAFPLFNPATGMVGMALAGCVFGPWAGVRGGQYVGAGGPARGGTELEPDWADARGAGLATVGPDSEQSEGLGDDLPDQRAGGGARARLDLAV